MGAPRLHRPTIVDFFRSSFWQGSPCPLSLSRHLDTSYRFGLEGWGMEQHSYSHEVMGCTPATPRSLRVRMAWISRGRRSSTPSTTAGASAMPSPSTATTRGAPVPAATAPALAAAALACVGAASGAAADCLAEGAPAMWHGGVGGGSATERCEGTRPRGHIQGHGARTPTLPAAAAVEAGATAFGALAPSASPGSPPASCMVEAMACSSRYRCMSCRSTCRMLSRTEGRAAKDGGRPRMGDGGVGICSCKRASMSSSQTLPEIQKLY